MPVGGGLDKLVKAKKLDGVLKDDDPAYSGKKVKECRIYSDM